MRKAIKDILKVIKKNDVITIYGHINPDGDSFGSGLALRDLIKLNFPEKKVYTIGYGLNQFYDRFGKYDEVDDKTIAESLAVILDCSEVERVSDQRIKLAKQIIKIDHHIENGPFFGIKWVDEGAIATCQLIAEFAFETKLKVNQHIAECMYLGICTDSGRFRYAPTNAKTHRIVAKLFDLGIETKTIFDILYISDEAFVKYQALLVSRFKRTKNNVIYCCADFPDYDQFGLKFEQISKNVNVIGNIKGCPIWVLFTRSKEGNIRVEYRSHGINVQQVAVKYGGGGHMCAAGCRLVDQQDFSLCMKIVEDLDKVAEESIKK